MIMVFDWHSQDCRASGPLEVAHTVTQQYGTGGGNTPIVVHDNLLCRATGQAGAEQTGVLTRGAAGLPYIIRRLAPLECGRLQGFPDGWAEIAPMNADDPEEILFWMGVYATDCKIKGKRINTEIIKHPAKLARWHDGLHSAAAEYKMWGNGMALPNALFFHPAAGRPVWLEHCQAGQSV